MTILKNKIRLLVTFKCPNKCELCCNNRFTEDTIPIVSYTEGYKEYIITGGEPTLFLDNLKKLVNYIRALNKSFVNNDVKEKIYLYTANFNTETFLQIINIFDGITYTIHNSSDIENFKNLNKLALELDIFKKCTLRLNIFPEHKNYLQSEDLSRWIVKDIVWQKDCPVPEDEDFKRINNLW